MTTRHQLTEIAGIAQRLLLEWNRFTETSDDLATTGDKLGVHGGDTPDPTLAGYYANQRVGEANAGITEALGILKAVERQVSGVVAEHPETVRIVDAAKRAARCADPVCDDNAVKHGYCERHWWTHRTSCATCRTGGAA
jgi:hypothetical protein